MVHPVSGDASMSGLKVTVLTCVCVSLFCHNEITAGTNLEDLHPLLMRVCMFVKCM